MKFQWEGIMPAVTTKFTTKDTLDLAMFSQNINAQLEAGVHGIVLGGTLGEASTLEDSEKRTLTTETVKLVEGKIPVMINIAEQTTKGAIDAANILKPALSRGELQCIGATTLDEYRENIEDDGALTRRFQEVFIDAPSIDDTIEILNRIKFNYEDYHTVEYTADAIEACVKMSERYIKSRELPDKAIDLMDEAGARTHLLEIKVPQHIKDLELDSENVKLKKKLAVVLD